MRYKYILCTVHVTVQVHRLSYIRYNYNKIYVLKHAQLRSTGFIEVYNVRI